MSARDNFGSDGAPLVLGSVFGSRVWKWNSKEFAIESPIKGLLWRDGVVHESECTYGREGSVASSRLWDKLVASFLPKGAMALSFEEGWDPNLNTPLGYYTLDWEVVLEFPEGVRKFRSDNPDLSISHAVEIETHRDCVRFTGQRIIGRKEVRSKEIELGAVTHTFHPECICGFYAYFSGEDNSFRQAHIQQVAGVIEGTGETVVGENGFRSQKARVVALAPMPFYPASPGPLSVSPQYSVPVTTEELKKRYPSAEVFNSPKEMYADVKVSSVEEFR